MPFVQQPALQLADTSGNVVRQAGTLVRATLLDAPGQLLNDVAVTNASGLAVFEQLTRQFAAGRTVVKSVYLRQNLGDIRQLAEAGIAGGDVALAVGDADDRFVKIIISESDSAQHGAVGGSFVAFRN